MRKSLLLTWKSNNTRITEFLEILNRNLSAKATEKVYKKDHLSHLCIKITRAKHHRTWKYSGWSKIRIYQQVPPLIIFCAISRKIAINWIKARIQTQTILRLRRNVRFTLSHRPTIIRVSLSKERAVRQVVGNTKCTIMRIPKLKTHSQTKLTQRTPQMETRSSSKIPKADSQH